MSDREATGRVLMLTRKLDQEFGKQGGWKRRLVLKLFRKYFADFAGVCICRAYERDIISSYQMHDLAGIYQDMLGDK